jgi:hypothetical protein
MKVFIEFTPLFVDMCGERDTKLKPIEFFTEQSLGPCL